MKIRHRIIKMIMLTFMILVIASCEKEKVTTKGPVLWFQRSASDKGSASDLDVRGRRLYLSDGDKLVHFNIEDPEAPTNKTELKRPQGVVASYINDKCLLEVTSSGKIRISPYNEPDRVISLIDQFEANTKIEFYQSYAFVGSGKNIAVIETKEPINIFQYTSFLSEVKDIAVTGKILTVSLSDGSFKMYDLEDLTEPVLISGTLQVEGMRYSFVDSYKDKLFVIEEHYTSENYSIVKQINPQDLKSWREVLKSYEPITKLYVKDEYLGLVRNNKKLDIYKIKEDNTLDKVLYIEGKKIMDIEIHQDHLFVADYYNENYLTLYKLN